MLHLLLLELDLCNCCRYWKIQPLSILLLNEWLIKNYEEVCVQSCNYKSRFIDKPNYECTIYQL